LAIAILGILAVILATVTAKRLKEARDAKRKADLILIQKALETAKVDSRSGSYYPSCESYDTYSNNKCPITDVSTNQDLVPSYIESIPSNPEGGGGMCTNYYSNAYCYMPKPFTCTGFGGAKPCTGYLITTCLENIDEPYSAKVTGTAFWTCPSTKAFKLENP